MYIIYDVVRFLRHKNIYSKTDPKSEAMLLSFSFNTLHISSKNYQDKYLLFFIVIAKCFVLNMKATASVYIMFPRSRPQFDSNMYIVVLFVKHISF